MTGGEFLGGEDASVDNFRNRAADANIIYLSCHGQFVYDDPLESALLLSANGSRPDRNCPKYSSHRISVRSILGLKLNARLVILDACMSGKQSFNPGDEPIGFPTAFLLAGAQAVIASNWVVEQRRGRLFMTALLEHWSNGGCTLGAAMQAAYTAVRDNHPHPFHWAPYSLFGNDRLCYIPPRKGEDQSSAKAASSPRDRG
jgi:CHAT domain-containing protein